MSALSVSAWLLLRLTVLHVLVLFPRHGSLATVRYYYYQGDPGERGPEGPRGQPGMDGRPVSTARFRFIGQSDPASLACFDLLARVH